MAIVYIPLIDNHTRYLSIHSLLIVECTDCGEDGGKLTEVVVEGEDVLRTAICETCIIKYVLYPRVTEITRIGVGGEDTGQ